MDGKNAPNTSGPQNTAVAPGAAPAARPLSASLPESTSRALADIALAWPRQAQWAAASLLALATLLLFIHAASFLPLGTQPTELQRGDSISTRLDLNHATRAELMQIPSVGPKLAEKIEKYRKTHGKFRRVDDLTKVGGIGPITLKRLRPWVFVEGENADTDEPRSDPEKFKVNQYAATPAPQKHTWNNGAAKSKIKDGERINVNTASLAELQRLPRIGPKLSQRIVDERKVRLFTSVDDLRRVYGIGAKTVERLRPYVCVK